MRRAVFATTLAAAAALGVWALASLAQDIDASPCERACYEQKSECVGECAKDNNPIECDEQCSNWLDDCLGRCRQ